MQSGKITWLILLVLVLVGLAGLGLNAMWRTRTSQVISIARTAVTAGNHHSMVVEAGGRLLQAEHNHAVIERAMDYIATIGFNTSVYREIVIIAAEAPAECERLDRVLDLAVRRLSDSGLVIALAKQAPYLATEEHEQRWDAMYENLSRSAEYASVEEALKELRSP